MRADSPLRRKCCGRARTSCGGSSCQTKDGGVTLWYVCLHCHRYPLEDNIWWVPSGHGKKQCNWWCAAGGGQYSWKAPHSVQVIQDSTERQQCFELTRCARSLRQLDQCAQALGKLAERWRQHSPDGGTGPSAEKLAQDNGWAQKVHHVLTTMRP